MKIVSLQNFFRDGRMLLLSLTFATCFLNTETFCEAYDINELDSNSCSSLDSDTCIEIPSDHYSDNSSFDEQWNRIKHTDSPLKNLYIDCIDNHERCKEWADYGECDKNPHFMHVSCRKSCSECVEYDVDMGEHQKIHGNEAVKTFEIYKKSVLYKKNEIVAQPHKHKLAVQTDCINKNELCAFWAAIGECTVNPNYMKLQCGPSCRSCHLIDINNRCPLDPNAKEAWGPNDLDEMFLKVTDINGPFKQYEPVVHSHPAGIVNEKNIFYGEDPILDGPWVVTFESFHTDEESDRLIELGGELGYERSSGVGAEKADGTLEKSTTNSRTSHNAWCFDGCEKDPLAQAVVDRIGNVTGIDQMNHEYLQLLKYTEGQFYRSHHDYIEKQLERQSGPRILTFFLYLNDVEEGGATGFTLLKKTSGDFKIYPKKGRALLWPSVLNSDPSLKDGRTEHEAMDVIKGEKYGANAWIHLRDFKTPNMNGCT